MLGGKEHGDLWGICSRRKISAQAACSTNVVQGHSRGGNEHANSYFHGIDCDFSETDATAPDLMSDRFARIESGASGVVTRV